MTAAELWDLPEGQVAPPELEGATALLNARISSNRISAVVRRRAAGLRGRSLLEIATEGDAPAVLSFVQTMFAFEKARGYDVRTGPRSRIW